MLHLHRDFSAPEHENTQGHCFMQLLQSIPFSLQRFQKQTKEGTCAVDVCGRLRSAGLT